MDSNTSDDTSILSRNSIWGVISSGSVVVKDVESMSVVGGNPAKEFKKRKCVHSSLVVESLLGGDYMVYKQTWKKRNIEKMKK